MQCVTPMFRRYEKGNHKKGTVVTRNEVMQGLELNENNIRMMLKIKNTNSKYGYEKIPCQKCWACQLNYSAEWATRIMLEAKKYENNWFITLTYDDNHVPVMSKIEYEEKYKDLDGNIETKNITVENDGTWRYSLNYPDVHKFINSLRKRYERKNGEKIKYYFCGEYGSETQRPHYHLILMNLPLKIEEFYDTHIDTNFKAHWKSKELESLWKKGMIDIAELEWSCAAYVARYCTKKLDFSGDKRIYLNKGLMPEKSYKSKGIGFDYYEDHKEEIYKNDEIVAKTVKGNVGRIKPPKAFDRKYKEHDPIGFKKIQMSRKKAAERAQKIMEQITDYTDLQKIKISARNLETKMSMLPRAGEW